MIKPQWLLESRLVLVCMTMLITALWSISPVYSNAPPRIFDVKKYGAVGDGKHDDAAAINRAIAAATAYPGSIVYFPPGLYYIDQNLSPVNGVTFKGEPNDASQLYFDGSSQIEIMGNSSAVENLFLSINGSNQNEAILVSAATNYTISGCNIGGWEYGVHTTGSATGQIVNNRIYAPNTLSTGASCIYLESATDTRIHGNTLDSIIMGNGYGVYDANVQSTLDVGANLFENLAEGLYANTGAQSATLKATNNTFTKCTTGLDCRSLSSVEVDTNTVKNSNYGLYFDGNVSLKCSNNSIDSPGNTAIYVFDYIDVTPHNTIVGNHITNLPNGTYGIYAAGKFISANPTSVITSNVISGPGYAGIYIFLQKNSSVTNNTISGVQYGIYSNKNSPVTISNNTVSNIQYSGIYSDADSFAAIDQNTLRNCGLSSGAYAVIYAYSNLGQDFHFADNTYTAKSTPNLSYFIYANVVQPIIFNGNKTDTTLQNYP